MRKDLDRRVRARARHRCEYCHLPQTSYLLRFQINHIIAEQHALFRLTALRKSMPELCAK
jgi:hypothetical protein